MAKTKMVKRTRMVNSTGKVIEVDVSGKFKPVSVKKGADLPEDTKPKWLMLNRELWGYTD